MWFWSLNADKVSVFLSVEVVLSPVFFVATRSDLSGQEGKCRSACSCLCGTSNIPACLSYQQTRTHKSLRLTVPGQSKSLCGCVLFHLCHSLKQSLKEEGRSKGFFTSSLFTWSSSSLNCGACGWFWSPEGYGRNGTMMTRCMELLLYEKSLSK